MKPWCVTIQMKAIEQYFHVILFVLLKFHIFSLDKAQANSDTFMLPFINLPCKNRALKFVSLDN